MASVVAATEAALHSPDPKEPVVAPLSQLALVLLSITPLFLGLDTNFNVIATAALAVYIGCRRSVKEGEGPSEDVMTNADALRFPLIGSAVLLGLFIVFKLFNKDLINALLTAYFVVLGCAAMSGTILPFVEVPFSAATIAHAYERRFKVPFVKDLVHVAVTLPEVCSFAASAIFCVWYFLQKHWLANNALGLSFSIQGIEHISIGKLSTGALLLSGLFFYDIFWVFGTPVMVTVAKSLDAPIKLVFPRAGVAAGESPFAMLGLGDIVIPGIFVALCLRYDMVHGSNYFRSAFGGYFTGLAATIVVMNVFQAAQPALLYIVPAVLVAVSIHSLLNGTAAQPKGGPLRARHVMRSTPNQGTYEGSSSPMGEDKQAKNMEAGLAPEGDKALEGEKVQLGGAAAPGPTDYDRSKKAEGAEHTTPAGESSEKKAGH